MPGAPQLPLNHLNTLVGHEGPVNCLRYTRDGAHLVSSSADRHVKLWNPETGVCIKTYKGHSKSVLSVALSPLTENNSKFASCSSDKTVILWDTMTGRVVTRFFGHYERVNDVAFSQDSSVIASGCYDSSVKFWDCKGHSGAPIQSFNEPKDSVECIAVSQHLVFAGCVDGHVYMYDIRAGLMTSDKIGSPVISMDLSEDKKCLLVGTSDDKIKLLYIDHGDILNEYKGHSVNMYKIPSRYIMKESCIVGGSSDGKLFFWDVMDAKTLKITNAHDSSISSIAVHPTKDGLVSSGTDSKIKIWG